MSAQSNSLTPRLLFIMAAACGLTVANLYYNQPLLNELRIEFGVGIDDVGRIPTLTQLGYAFGMFLLTPLGDKYNRKTLIVGATLLVACSLLLTAFAGSFLMLQLGSALVGLSAIGAQIIIPHVAQIAPEKNRGASVGKVMTGLLLGILLARTLSGFIGSIWGWRSVYGLSSAMMIFLALAMARVLPSSVPSFRGTYAGLMRSILELVKSEPVLRQSAFVGGCLFASFSATWATLIFLLSSDAYQLGAKSAGLFGLLGAAGAIAASLVGRVADKRSPIWTLMVALVVTLLSFLELGLTGQNLLGLMIGFFVMDAGVQAAHVSNQARFFSIRPEARSRMNTVYMFCYFLGGALGSFLGAWCWKHWQWAGVTTLSFGFILLALSAVLPTYLKRHQNGTQISTRA